MEPFILFEMERELGAFSPEDRQEMFSASRGGPESFTLVIPTADWENLGSPHTIEIKVTRR